MTQLSLDAGMNLDERIAEVLAGKNVPWAPESEQAVLLEMLRSHKGAADALPLQTISVQLGMSAREVKEAVKSLIEDFKLPIGGSRQKPYGYFLIVTADDLEQALRPLTGEIRSMARRVRALTSEQQLGEIFNQVRMELNQLPVASGQWPERGAK
jgi:hypothetical protein